jgi:hypothetical protein
MNSLNGFTIAFLLCLNVTICGQGISISSQPNSTPHSSAALDLQDSTRGFLPNRMTTAQRNAIVSPAVGLHIFNITTQCVEVYFANGWRPSICECSQPPSVPASISGPDSACIQASALTFSTPAVSNASTYQWTVPAGASIVSGQGTNTITVNLGNQSGTVAVSAGNGCGSSSLFSKPLTAVTPSASFSPSAGSINTPVSFIPQGQGYASYLWSFAGGTPATSTSANPQVTWQSTGNYLVTLQAEWQPGCTATDTQSISIINCPSGAQTFSYTGSPQVFVVPNCVNSITVTTYGAEGGISNGASGSGGRGGMAQATIPVTPGETLHVYVGQMGPSGSSLLTGGWNGGGGTNLSCIGDLIGGGGGASDIRRSPYSLSDRLIVAGGGGGGGYEPAQYPTNLGGAGGGTNGTDGGTASWCTPSCNGKGGTQSAGGAGGQRGSDPNGENGMFGVGGRGRGSCSGGGGGGGGWYGGGGGQAAAGGGGSSYVSAPGNTATSTTPGVRTGNGEVTISY